jgi:soluble lytic murein transglycosylase-like protein
MAYQSSIAFEVRLQMYPKNFDKKLIQYIKEECLRSQVPFSLICALIKKESQWYINCHSDNYYKKKLMSTDYGLMQLNNLYSRGFIIQFKDKFRTIESYDVIDNPYDNVQIGIRHLRFLYDQLGNWRKSVMAYNAGIYRVLTKNVPDSTIAYVKEVCPIDNWWVMYRIAE